MKITKNFIGAVAALFLLPAAASANVVYQSPDWVSPGANPGGDWCSTCNGTWYVSDQFVLGDDTTITGLDLEVVDWYGSNWNVNISIWDATQTTMLFETFITFGNYTNTASTTSGSRILGFNFAGPDLAAGTYRMQWFDPDAMAIHAYTGNSTTSQQTTARNNTGGRGGGYGKGIRFQVYGGERMAVPEPGALWLLGLGLLATGMLRRRRSA